MTRDGDGANDALAEGMHGTFARASRGLGAAVDGSSEWQDELAARVDRCAHELEVLLEAMPEDASGDHARRLRAVRARVDGLGASAKNLRERVRNLHDATTTMRRANLAALAGCAPGEFAAGQGVRSDRGGGGVERRRRGVVGAVRDRARREYLMCRLFEHYLNVELP